MHLLHRRIALCVATLFTAACGGAGAPTAEPTSPPTQGAIATLVPTAAPTAAPVTAKPEPTLIPACLPACWTGRLVRPGAISGTYTTKNFFGGNLTVTVPDGWASGEDSTGEFSLGLPGDDTAGLDFWIDVFAVTGAGQRDNSVQMDADSMVAFFTSKPIHKIIGKSTVTVGGLPGVRIEYKRNPKAATDDPSCPAAIQPCSSVFSYPEWQGEWFGEGGPFHSQLIVIDAMWGGLRHTIYIEFWGDDASFPKLLDQMNAVIASVKWPEGVAAHS